MSEPVSKKAVRLQKSMTPEAFNTLITLRLKALDDGAEMWRIDTYLFAMKIKQLEGVK